MSEHDHKHHVPNPEDIPKIQAIREATIAYEKMLDELCPPGRDLSIAKTNLEQARMWGIAALVKRRPPESIVTGAPTVDSVTEVSN